MTTTKAFLAALRRDIEAHPATNHIFLNRVATAPFSREDYRVFGENHYPLVCVFTSYLERLMCRAPSSEAKLWLARVLVDEYGQADGQDHAALYGHFLRACGSRAAGDGAVRVPAPALAFVREHRRIVTREPFLVGLGAVGPGHEWAIPRMFESVIPGLRRAGFDETEIAYFTLHVHQDEDHGAWLEEALALYATTERAQAEVRRGAMLSLDARGRFWSGVQRAVVRWRQPRAARPDGARPRSIAHEIALTAWDGWRTGQRVDAGWRSLAERARPTMQGLLAGIRT